MKNLIKYLIITIAIISAFASCSDGVKIYRAKDTNTGLITNVHTDESRRLVLGDTIEVMWNNGDRAYIPVLKLGSSLTMNPDYRTVIIID